MYSLMLLGFFFLISYNFLSWQIVNQFQECSGLKHSFLNLQYLTTHFPVYREGV